MAIGFVLVERIVIVLSDHKSTSTVGFYLPRIENSYKLFIVNFLLFSETKLPVTHCLGLKIQMGLGMSLCY